MGLWAQHNGQCLVIQVMTVHFAVAPGPKVSGVAVRVVFSADSTNGCLDLTRPTPSQVLKADLQRPSARLK